MPTDQKIFPYRGGYTLELASGAPRHILPKAAFLEGEFVRVLEGRIGQADEGFVFSVADSVAAPNRTGGEFVYDKKYIKRILNTAGIELWPNPER